MKRFCAIMCLFSLTLVTSILTGCGGSGDRVLAEVDGHNITVQEFEDYFRNLKTRFASAEEEFARRRVVLDTMIVDRLLIDEAYRKDIDKLEDLSRAILANKDKFLLDVLYSTHVIDESQVSEADIKDQWEMLEFKIRASHILVEDLDTAQALLVRIENGENFEKLAYEHSLDPSAKRNRGDLGYLLWGALVDDFQTVAFAMDIGQVSTPVKTKFGYHIVKLVDRLPNDRYASYESMKPDIKRQLTSRARSRQSLKYYEEVRFKYAVSIDTNTCDYLMRKREAMYPPLILATLPDDDFDVEQLDRNERELVLATWDGGQMTIYEYLQKAKQIPSNLKPTLNDYDSLANIVFQLNKMDILVLEGTREGLENHPDYLRKIKMFKELSMADIMRNDSLPKPLPPDEEMIRKYFEDHLDEYTEPAKVHVYEIMLSDELKARKLSKEIKSLNNFKTMAMDLTERPGKRATSGDLGYIERRWYPEIFDLARKTPFGKVGGPVVTQGKYSIFWLIDKLDEQVRDFLTVKAEITLRLNQELANESFVKWVELRKSKVHIELYEDVLWSTIDRDSYATADTSSAGL